MFRIISPLLFLLARTTQAELSPHIQCLKVENEILRFSLPNHIRTTPVERTKLLRFGKVLGLSLRNRTTHCQPTVFITSAIVHLAADLADGSTSGGLVFVI